MKSFKRVNAFTEWGKLKQVVVGKADYGCNVINHAVSQFKINDPYLASQFRYPTGMKKQDFIDRANIQLDNFAQILEKEGVTVYRPDPFDFSKPTTTPFFHSVNQYTVACPRDVVATVGNIILESSMCIRERAFEVHAYRNIINQLWENDPNCLWKSIPPSSLDDSVFNFAWNDLTDEQKTNSIRNTSFSVKNNSFICDVANFMKTGKHVFAFVSHSCNLKSIKWLKREFATHGIEFHPIRATKDIDAHHIDCNLQIVKPGLAIQNPKAPLFPEYTQFFKDNDWKIIDAPQPDVKEVQPLSTCSMWLSMNVLIISPTKAVVEKREESMAKQLEDNGFQCIPIDFRDVYEFGGGLHCATWDIEREDSMVDLFPNLQNRVEIDEYDPYN